MPSPFASGAVVMLTYYWAEIEPAWIAATSALVVLGTLPPTNLHAAPYYRGSFLRPGPTPRPWARRSLQRSEAHFSGAKRTSHSVPGPGRASTGNCGESERKGGGAGGGPGRSTVT